MNDLECIIRFLKSFKQFHTHTRCTLLSYFYSCLVAACLTNIEIVTVHCDVSTTNTEWSSDELELFQTRNFKKKSKQILWTSKPWWCTTCRSGRFFIVLRQYLSVTHRHRSGWNYGGTQGEHLADHSRLERRQSNTNHVYYRVAQNKPDYSNFQPNVWKFAQNNVFNSRSA